MPRERYNRGEARHERAIRHMRELDRHNALGRYYDQAGAQGRAHIIRTMKYAGYVAGAAALAAGAGVSKATHALIKKGMSAWKHESVGAQQQLRGMKRVAEGPQSPPPELEDEEGGTNINEVTFEQEIDVNGHNINNMIAGVPESSRTLRGSTEENAVIRAPTLIAKRKSNKRFRHEFERMRERYFEAMCPRIVLREEGHDMKFSVAADGITRLGGCAAVFVKSFSVLDLGPLIAAVKQAVPAAGTTGQGLADIQLASYSFDMKAEYTWQNTTNVNVRVAFKDHTAVIDSADGYGLLECWKSDLVNGWGYSRRYAQLALVNAYDVGNVALDVRSIDTWRCGVFGSVTKAHWGTGNQWSIAIVPPGGKICKNMVWSGTLTQEEYTRTTQTTAYHYLAGMPAFVVKCIGEDIFNNLTGSETVGEQAIASATGAAAVAYTSAPVQLAETCVLTGAMRYCPGYEATTMTIGNRAPANAGQVGIVADIPYATAKDFVRINGDGNGLNGFTDLGDFTTLETAAADKAGAEEGMVLVGDND